MTTATTPSLPTPVSRRDTPRIQRVRHELRRRALSVVRVEPLGPHLVAVTFGGESLADFVSLGFDDHVKFMLNGADGEPIRRDYTPRHFDLARRELTIEFALHGDADHAVVPAHADVTASAWARAAAPGQPAVIGGPRGSMVIAADHDWHLLVGDLTALPAIRRRLEELPAGTCAQVLLLLPEADERLLPASRAAVEVQVATTPDELVAAVERLQLPAGDGFAWGAGEAGVMARVRAVLVGHHGLPREAVRVSAYWKRGAADFHETLEG